jgi:hypothetical protein
MTTQNKMPKNVEKKPPVRIKVTIKREVPRHKHKRPTSVSNDLRQTEQIKVRRTRKSKEAEVPHTDSLHKREVAHKRAEQTHRETMQDRASSRVKNSLEKRDKAFNDKLNKPKIIGGQEPYPHITRVQIPDKHSKNEGTGKNFKKGEN